MMLYAGRKVKKPKFQIGDIVRVKGFKSLNKIGYMSYRYADGAKKGWFYRVHGEHGTYLTWSEDNLRKVSKQRRK